MGEMLMRPTDVFRRQVFSPLMDIVWSQLLRGNIVIHNTSDIEILDDRFILHFDRLENVPSRENRVSPALVHIDSCNR